MQESEQLIGTIRKNVADALSEDLGTGDLTANLVAENASARAIVIARESIILSGQSWVDEVFQQLDPQVAIDWLCNDGDTVLADAEICIISGSARSILSGERTALNFMQLLSGTATTTARYVRAAEGTKARILDTRKTIPGLRLAQKYAVRCGGGNNHRIGLYDAILIKENHIVSCGSITAAVSTAKQIHKGLPIEVEVESLTELEEALNSQADRLLLDNFSITDLQAAVDVNQEQGNPPAELEASGGITLESIRSIAETGVDYISVGALTKDVTAADLSMRFRYDN